MADIKGLVRDPEFQSLPFDQRRQLLAEADPEFAAVSPQEQSQLLVEMKSQPWWGGAKPKMQPTPTPGARVMPETLGGKVKRIAREAAPTVRQTLQGVGATLGSLVGGGTALVAGQLGPQAFTPEEVATVPIGATTGGALGYAGGKRLADIYDQAVGIQEAPQSLRDVSMRTLRDIGEGYAGEIMGLGLGGLVAGAPRAARAAGDFAAGVIGTTTGTGKEYVKQAVKGNKTFAANMRNPEGERIVNTAKSALGTLKDARGAEYRAKLEGIAADKQQLDITPIAAQWGTFKKKFGIQETEDGALDLSRSTLSRKELADVTEINDMIKSWGTQEGDLTPMGLDLLKRKLDNLYTESKDSRAIVAGLRNTVKQTIVKSVPEYADMTKGYEEATKLITELERTLSLGKKPMLDTTMRKLQQAMRDNFQFRKELLDTLEVKSGDDLADMIAGYSMSSWAPQGGFGRLTAGGGIAGMTFSHTITPAYIGLMAVSSPRVVGETLHALGATGKQVGKIMKVLPQAKQIMQQSGAAWERFKERNPKLAEQYGKIKDKRK